MDEARLEALGLKPLDRRLRAIDAVKDKSELPALIAQLQQIGVHDAVRSRHRPGQAQLDRLRRLPVAVGARACRTATTTSTTTISALVSIRKKYGEHIEKMLAMAGDKTAKQDAADILALETAMARAHWTKVESRDPVKTYDKVAHRRICASDRAWLRLDSLPRRARASRRRSPTSCSTSRATSRTSARSSRRRRWPSGRPIFSGRRCATTRASSTSSYVDERFAFYGTVLSGVPQNRPRWQRGVALVNESIGEALGRVYVAKYFPPESKARMEKLVANLLARLQAEHRQPRLDGTARPRRKRRRSSRRSRRRSATRRSGATTRSSTIAPDDLVGNVMRARALRIRPQCREARQADRSRRVVHDAADGERLLQPDDERDRVPGRDPAAAVLQRRGRRRRQLRRHRRDDRPRDQPRLRRLRQPVRRRRQPARLVDDGQTTSTSTRRRRRSSRSSTPTARCPATTSTAS